MTKRNKKMRPRRLYKSKTGKFYYLRKGKKVFVKVGKKATDKQIIKVNIKNVIEMPKRKRRKKRRKLKFGNDFLGIMKPVQKQGLPYFTLPKIRDPVVKIDESKKVEKEQVNYQEFLKKKPKIPKVITSGDIDLDKILSLLKTKTIDGPVSEFKTEDDFLKDTVKELVGEEKKTGYFTPKGFKKIVADNFKRRRPFVIYNDFVMYLAGLKGNKKKDFRPLTSVSHSKYTLFRNIFDDGLREYNESGDNVRREKETEDALELLDELDAVESVKRSEGDDALALLDELDGMIGKGRGKTVQEMAETGGLWDNEIETILKQKIGEKYIPVLPRDKVSDLPDMVRDNDTMFAAVINTVSSKYDGTGTDGGPSGHWFVLLVDAGCDFSIEYFDPLVSGIPDDIREVGMEIAKRMNPEVMFKLKVNRLTRQAEESDTCALHAIQFIQDRFDGDSFAEASGYNSFIERGNFNDTKEGEKYILENFPKYNKML